MPAHVSISLRTGILLLGLLAIIVATGLTGCRRDEPRAEADEAVSAVAIQDHLAQVFVRGLEYNGTHIKADRYEPLGRRLVNVQITAQGILLNADRAEIRVNLAESTGQIILYDAVSANYNSPTTGSASDGGELVRFARLELDPFPLTGF
jgi:hypothetical protein